MTWWQILLAIVFTVPWLYMFVLGVILEPLSQNHRYKKKSKAWDDANPTLQRRLCKGCKYSISETYFEGRYPKGIPRRGPVYCTLTRRNIKSDRCIIAEPPTNYFYEPKNKVEPKPCQDAKIYFSAYGNCYHSTPHCSSIKNSRNLYSYQIYLSDRYPCPKCWIEKNGTLFPKK